jgi:hypothetical protein
MYVRFKRRPQFSDATFHQGKKIECITDTGEPDYYIHTL